MNRAAGGTGARACTRSWPVALVLGDRIIIFLIVVSINFFCHSIGSMLDGVPLKSWYINSSRRRRLFSLPTKRTWTSQGFDIFITNAVSNRLFNHENARDWACTPRWSSASAARAGHRIISSARRSSKSRDRLGTRKSCTVSF